MNQLNLEKIGQLVTLFQEVKSEIKTWDKHFYERWKAGGYLIDQSILSDYPNLEELLWTPEEKDEDET